MVEDNECLKRDRLKVNRGCIEKLFFVENKRRDNWVVFWINKEHKGFVET